MIRSGVTHSHSTGDYRVRRAECKRAARLLGVGELRDLEGRAVDSSKLPEPLGRRARHVVTENARVLEAVEAIRRNDPLSPGELFDASHVSMRDDYEVSTPEIDLLVSRVRAQPGVYGARLTGGGFGGAIVALANPADARRAAEEGGRVRARVRPAADRARRRRRRHPARLNAATGSARRGARSTT